MARKGWVFTNFRRSSERTGYAYVRGIYATDDAALGDLPNALPADADGSHWSPGPHNAECCVVHAVEVKTIPSGMPYVENWWQQAK